MCDGLVGVIENNLQDHFRNQIKSVLTIQKMRLCETANFVLEVEETFCDDKAHFIFVEYRLSVFAQEVNSHLEICLANVVMLNNVYVFLHYISMKGRKHSKRYQKRVDCDAAVDDFQQICVDGCYI